MRFGRSLFCRQQIVSYYIPNDLLSSIDWLLIAAPPPLSPKNTAGGTTALPGTTLSRQCDGRGPPPPFQPKIANLCLGQTRSTRRTGHITGTHAPSSPLSRSPGQRLSSYVCTNAFYGGSPVLNTSSPGSLGRGVCLARRCMWGMGIISGSFICLGVGWRVGAGCRGGWCL